MIKTIFSYDFRYTAINQIWRLLSGPALLLLIPLYLTPEAQGYWYTFISLGALAILADMGFSTILLQFSAHEFAHLKHNNNGEISGNSHHLQRLGTLWQFSIKWSITISLIFFPLIFIAGFIILNLKNEGVIWKVPWFIYSTGALILFINNMILSFVEGLNKVGDTQKIRFYISASNITLLIITLTNQMQLFALAASLLLSSIIGTTLIIFRFKKTFYYLNNISNNSKISWFSEMKPLLWRYSLSWISGYFILSALTPIAFYFYGTNEAGRVGFSLAMFTALMSISNIWITIILPKLNMLCAQKEHHNMRIMINKHGLFSLITYITGSLLFISLVSLMKEDLVFFERLVEVKSLVIISITIFIHMLINLMATYMRAYKKEPLVWISLISGMYITTSSLFLAKHIHFDYYFIGYLSSYTLSLPVVYLIFRNFIKNHEQIK